MNTKSKAITEIKNFLDSDDLCLLLTGTHMFEKHPLLLRVLVSELNNKTILFRVNSMNNLDTILQDSKLKTGVPYSLGSNQLYIDSLNVRTWNKSPYKVDYSIVYPIGSIMKENKYDKRVLDDLKNRTTEKIFLVSCYENNDFSLLDDIVDFKVAYDSEEDDVDYHNRVIDNINKKNYY